MSMSSGVQGFKPPDAKWKKMKAIWDACKSAKIDPPIEVETFFNGEEPTDKGMEVEIEANVWSDEYRQGIEVDIKRLPADVTIIRFYNSW